jgi:GTP-binding protein LepA
MTPAIRNFCIIAHIDHGKSTLADRLLEITGTIAHRDMRSQTLDTMDLEQERWITIKLTPVRMDWKGYMLNLIDTPGHVDFQYEVSRSLASVEGAILVVDASQGIEAQTLSNVYMAIENDLTIIPVLNKIDLPSADPERVAWEIMNLLWCKREDILSVSAKTWMNVEQVLDAVIEQIPPPKRLTAQSQLIVHTDENYESTTTKALVFDSQYDPYKGVVVYVKLFSWIISRGSKLQFLNTGSTIEALEVWCFRPKYHALATINAGEIGYIVTGLKTIYDARVGDTLFAGNQEFKASIPGFKQITPFIFAGVYPVDTDEYPKLKDSLEKLQMNDSSLHIENEVSPALWHGYRCGFLGLLHLDIVKERLYREFDMDVIMTSPQVTYRVTVAGDKTGEFHRMHPELVEVPSAHRMSAAQATRFYVSNPEDLPAPGNYLILEEPIAHVEIITPSDFVGNLMQLAQERRWKFLNQNYLDSQRVVLIYELPLAELIWDFYDELKSLSSGYGSLSYEFLRYQEDDLLKMDILVAWEWVEAFSSILHRDRARYIWGSICRKLKEEIPRAQFAISIQAAIGNQVIAREDISALRKDVTAKLYGGDVSRKRKLLEKQKEGKKKMKQFWRVSIPSETFVNILKK